jgi:hypothetical protein
MHDPSPREAIRLAAASSDRLLGAGDLDVPAYALALTGPGHGSTKVSLPPADPSMSWPK